MTNMCALYINISIQICMYVSMHPCTYVCMFMRVYVWWPSAKANRQCCQVAWMLARHWDALSSFFSLILDSSVGLWVGIQSAGDLASQTSKFWIQYSAEEDKWFPFDSKIDCLGPGIEINNNKQRGNHQNILKHCLGLYVIILCRIEIWYVHKS